MHRLAAFLCAPLLAGCTLIDQRTFDPAAGLPAQVQAPPGPPPIQALVTIDVGRANLDYAAALQQAVRQAVARKPDVQFDVVSVVPAKGTPGDQVAAATGITGDARDVARAINADGVDDDRIHLSARADPGAAGRQVQVFVH